LRPKKQEIRLLTILLGDVDDEIKTTLSVVSLQKRPVYEALSYVWGDPTITKLIYVIGTEFEVTDNLFAALRSLRPTNGSRIFWVDAICVDQGNLVERS
ncbi:heterokaryon incompatibility protein-domain-containing protein, partial [Leptodontidium sp. MPI-SDFR-AT-0119]